ncbi:fumarylacetoacetate hydrolase family protein [Bradyrhizobium diazoefficiens]|nr:fumarylacetoacetate hydrolase family protein [Bradyrhizobium diazoefficiens]QQO19106.1 fumarylacetoacetate hydrolase family protein [Bradyrhizobium diazoefficiens]
MKLLRIGPAGAEKPALLDSKNTLRDLSKHVRDFDAAALSKAGLATLAAIDPASLPMIDAAPRIGPCVPRPVNFVCIGLNYVDHAHEAGLPIPEEPIVFLKSLGSIQGPNDPVRLPRGSVKTDWEVELGIVIGSSARYVSEAEALAHVAGYCIVNDVSERSLQLERGGTWDKGKGADTFGPIGPWLVTADEVPDPQALRLWTEVNGARMQDGSTATMIFDVRKIVSYVSQLWTLHPGDIIATGTPPGVGMGKKPEPIFLRAGQTMRLGIDGLGIQTQSVVAD